MQKRMTSMSDGEQEALQAELINMANLVWNGSKDTAKVSFAPSEKLKNVLAEIQGANVNRVFITDSDVRHIKSSHGQNEANRGQVNITPDDFALIPVVMNEFDRVVEVRTDTLGNKSVLFEKRMNGTVFVAGLERGKKREQVITMWKKPHRVSDVQAPDLTSKTTPEDGLVFDKKLTGEPMPEKSSEVLTSETAPDLFSFSEDTTISSESQVLAQKIAPSPLLSQIMSATEDELRQRINNNNSNTLKL